MNLFARTAAALAATASGAAALAAEPPWYTQGDFAPKVRIALDVVNPLDTARRSGPVVVRRDQMPLQDLHEMAVTVVDPQLPPSPEPSAQRKKLAGGHELRQERNGHALFHQMDDLDKDGVWDELFFMVDIEPGQTKRIFVYLGINQRGWNPHETHAAVGSYCRHLVPFWESKNIGWKLWFPTSVDVYGKREPLLMANRLYMENLDGYGVSLIDSALGSDIMSVSTSFGGGGICLFEDPGKPELASLPRFTPARLAAGGSANFNAGQITDTRYSFDVVANGPMRSMVRVRTMNWDTGRGRFELEQLYTAYAHQSYSTCQVRFTRFQPREGEVRFGAAIRKKPNEKNHYREGGVLISSGPEAITDPDDGTISANLEFIGNALVVKDSYAPQYQFIPDWEGNHAFRFPYREDGVYEYLIAAAWSEGAVLKNHSQFERYVVQTAREYNAPLQVRSAGTERRP